jgi:hypothetical protein
MHLTAVTVRSVRLAVQTRNGRLLIAGGQAKQVYHGRRRVSLCDHWVRVRTCILIKALKQTGTMHRNASLEWQTGADCGHIQTLTFEYVDEISKGFIKHVQYYGANLTDVPVNAHLVHS